MAVPNTGDYIHQHCESSRSQGSRVGLFLLGCFATNITFAGPTDVTTPHQPTSYNHPEPAIRPTTKI
jgi:hypothetical protein